MKNFQRVTFGQAIKELGLSNQIQDSNTYGFRTITPKDGGKSFVVFSISTGNKTPEGFEETVDFSFPKSIGNQDPEEWFNTNYQSLMVNTTTSEAGRQSYTLYVGGLNLRACAVNLANLL